VGVIGGVRLVYSVREEKERDKRKSPYERVNGSKRVCACVCVCVGVSQERQ